MVGVLYHIRPDFHAYDKEGYEGLLRNEKISEKQDKKEGKGQDSYARDNSLH